MKNMLVLDIEVLPNYFLVALKGLNSGKVLLLSAFGDNAKLSPDELRRLNSMLINYTTFGYNSINYDMPIIHLILNGGTTKEVFNTSKTIVEKGQPSWITYRQLDIQPNQLFDHFDLQEPAPAVMISLKNYGTRIGSQKLQEFYLDPYEPITKDDIESLEKYCINDLDVTIDLYNAIKGRIDLRISMSEQYGTDLRSKSDAQIAEEIFKIELAKKGKTIQKVKANDRLLKQIEYKCPKFIEFESKQLTEIKDLFHNSVFKINQANGQPILPKEWTKFIKPKIGQNTYKLGLGGIHSQEKGLSIVAPKGYTLRNADIASMYPSIILELCLFPKSLGKQFLSVYGEIYKTRLEAKRTGDKLVNEALKIALNGSYGKFGSYYSFLYAPDLMLTVTLTGQLMMLMLIEQLEKKGFRVLSANTDGVEYLCADNKVELAEAIILDWELQTGMNMEHGQYKALHAKDVNNYVAVYDGYVKSKGLYTETTLSKGRSTPIVYEAIRKYLLDGTRLYKTIHNCSDMNEFVSARTVNGGATYKGEYLGKMVRWYYSKNGDSIHYANNGNLVPKTGEGRGVKPMMDLTSNLPDDIDYDWYYNEAISKLKDLGVDYE